MRIPALMMFIFIALQTVLIAQEEDWAKAMFSATAHDFGVVARGAKVEHKFVIENKYEENAQISSIQSSCGCTSVKIDKKFLKNLGEGRAYGGSRYSLVPGSQGRYDHG